MAQSSALRDHPTSNDASDMQSSIYRGHVAIAIIMWRQVLRRLQGHQSSTCRFQSRHVIELSAYKLEPFVVHMKWENNASSNTLWVTVGSIRGKLF